MSSSTIYVDQADTGHSEIGNYPFHRPRVAERSFRGLMIRTGWKLKRLDTSTAALMIVMLWKVTGGNWEAAFAAGAFYIMLVNLSPMVRK